LLFPETTNEDIGQAKTKLLGQRDNRQMTLLQTWSITWPEKFEL